MVFEQKSQAGESDLEGMRKDEVRNPDPHLGFHVGSYEDFDFHSE